MINGDKLEGQAQTLAGTAQEKLGDVLGDDRQKAEGFTRRVEGRAQDAYGEASERVHQAADRVVHVVETQPLASLLIVGALGYVLGLLTPRR